MGITGTPRGHRPRARTRVLVVPAELRIDQVPITHPDALRLIDVLQAEYRIRYGGPDRTPLQPTYFEPPEGASTWAIAMTHP